MRYDAVVVGAGPAGLTFARFLASKGFRVAVLERNETLAVKPCGEGISARVPVTAELSRSDVPRFVSREIRGALVVAPNGKGVTITGEGGDMGYVINKRIFLRVLGEYAASAGADIYMKEPVREALRSNGAVKVTARTVEVEASLLVGADGYMSFVAKKFGLESPGERKVIPTVQYVMANVSTPDPSLTYFYLGNDVAPKGYVWVFPKDGTIANVGIGVQGAAPRAYLDKFIKSHPEMFAKAKILEFQGAAVTISGLLKRITSDNVMLIGEAAGQVIPLTGGGIHTSVAGGKIAAEVAAKALEEGDLSERALSEYRRRYDEYWGRRIRDSLKALHAIEKLSDDELNQLAEILTGEDIVNLANGENVAKVALKLLKHPVFSIKLARALLSE
jgi:digeranylgeranylglycerophospholipid reductase